MQISSHSDFFFCLLKIHFISMYVFACMYVYMHMGAPKARRGC